MGNTKIDLVKDLETILQDRKEMDVELKTAVLGLIDLAKAGHFHDFESTRPTPKMDLFQCLHALGFKDLADKVINGDYDE